VQPEEVAEEYFRCIRDKDANGIARFFSKDAARITYKGASAHGHEAVVDWYVTQDFAVNYVWHLPDGTVFEPGPDDSPPIGSLRPMLPGIVAGNRAVVEVQVDLNDGERYYVLDLFTLDGDGAVRQVQVYRGGYVPQ
jgi:hypothetical protein